MNKFNQFEGNKKPITASEKEAAPKKIFKKELERETYHFHAIKELEAPIANLIESLHEAIDKGEYDTLIGDDTSGRIPTLAFQKIFASRIRELHPNLTAEEDREKLKTFFIAGGRRKNDQALLEFFKKIKPGIKKKALVVTEYVGSGKSILRISKLLEEAGISFDIVTLFAVAAGKYAEVEEYREQGKILGTKGHNLLLGYGFGVLPEIYWQPSLAGLEKEEFKDDNVPHAYVKRGDDENVKMARQDVGLLANKVLEEVWGENVFRPWRKK